ncbi:hypothetical protein [Gallibacterium sp. AGMB14963]|uniref:baseplate complex protein n=1 Tax=Gallibacterium faecale TaxID=3019086 RepID=UPI0022F1C636|nr:hypothetical protein [Gallibacterium sp. AGMB14963]MDA3978103.1 hypothetical protein [Gallibacterium sp. AGMB14963]
MSLVSDIFGQRRRPSVQLSLNGKPIYMSNMIITVSMRREEKDMSGQKSSTKKTDKGVKAKEINVTGIIAYRDKQNLTDLFNLAEAVDKKGEQVKYRVAAISAEAINMREVQFTDEISVVEQTNLLAWQVSFKLREINSVSEKKEQRKKKPTTKVQQETKATQAQSTQQSKDANADSSLRTDFDKLLEKAGF